MKPQCRSCGSSRLIARARLASKSFMLGRPDVLLEVPQTTLLGAPVTSRVAVSVCVDCGALELRASDLPALLRAYESLSGPSLDLAAEGV